MHVLLIDPESSGLDLLDELRKRGVAVTTWHQATPFQLDTADDCSSPDPRLVSMAAEGDFDWIVPGGESGVTAAEWLAHHLGLPVSEPEFMHHRRDKNSMIRRVADHGLDTGRSSLITDIDELDEMLQHVELPLMIKPSNSAGSDMCRRVDTVAEATAFCAEVLESTSIMGNRNVGAVVQEFLAGPQYHVNTVVIGGVHRVTEVYSNLFRMPGGRPQLFAGRTHLASEPGVQTIIDYTLGVLDALGVTAGATHTEIRLTSRGPRLVEFNGRLMGPAQPTDYFVHAQGFSQASLYADVLAGRASVAERQLGDARHRDFLGFYLPTAANSGILTAFSEDRLLDLSSYRCVAKNPRVGDRVTVDNRTTDADLGILFLAHEDAAQLESDLARVAQLEELGLIHTVSPS